MQFWLGTHVPNWLAVTDVPLFVSHGTLRLRKSLPRAKGQWCLDSRGFTELSMNGQWTITPQEYVAATRRYMQEIGGLQWASPQDWMCEPWIIERTGLSIREHQRRTIASVLELRSMAPDVPWAAVLQGWEPSDYYEHVEMYAKAGVDLRSEPIVGLGTLCRRQATSTAEDVISTLHQWGIRLHGFGIKITGLLRISPYLASADSMAWSYGARYCPPCICGSTKHKNGANCRVYALNWLAKVTDAIARPTQLRLLVNNAYTGPVENVAYDYKR